MFILQTFNSSGILVEEIQIPELFEPFSMKPISRSSKQFLNDCKKEMFLLQKREVIIDGKQYNLLLSSANTKRLEWFNLKKDFQNV